MQGAGSARGNVRQGANSVYNPNDPNNQKMGRTLMNKFNPFNKRSGDNAAIEYGGSKKKPTEERKIGSGIYLRGSRGPSSPYKISKDPGESFLDLYTDTDFAELTTPEIVDKLNKNLKSFRNFHAKASKQVEDLKNEQAKNKQIAKGREIIPEDQEVNEELDKRMTQVFELELKIKSLEQLIAKLNEEKTLEQEVARKNQEIKNNQEELERKDEELANEKKAQQEYLDNLREDLTEQINEV